MPSTIDLRQDDPVAGRVPESVHCFSAHELSGDLAKSVVAAIRRACQQHGFFYVDLSEAQRISVAKTLIQMQRFFSLPDADPSKQRAQRGDKDFGWVPKGTEPAYQPGTVSSLEAFDYGKACFEADDRDTWPPLPGFRSNLLECWRRYCELGDDILQALALAAGLQRDFLRNRCASRDLNTMRLLHYAAEPDTDRNRKVGIAAHTDFECITLLYQTAAGLELLDSAGCWRDAPAQSGRVVVLLGDMLERWTNGMFAATGHRVRNTSQQRFSIVQFFAVDPAIEVAPLPHFVSAASPPKYSAITQDQHIEAEVGRADENAREAESAD